MEAAFLNRRRSVSVSTGTGNFSLAAGTGPWSPISYDELSDNPFVYCIAMVDGIQWEVGIGHLSDVSTLVRDFVEDSSDLDSGVAAQVNFPAGSKEVFMAFPASYLGGVRAVTQGGVPNAGIAAYTETADATPTEVSPPFNGQAPGTTGVYEVTVLAVSDTGKAKSWKASYMAVFDDPDYTMYGKTVDVIGQSESLPWDVDVLLDDVNHRVEVTGAAATNITWRIFGGIKATDTPE